MVDGHLSREQRAVIRAWRPGAGPCITKKNIRHLLDTIEEACRWPDFCIDYEMVWDDLNEKPVVLLHYSTGGWSGHEDLIHELKHTMFWLICWESSRRGGHHVFRI